MSQAEFEYIGNELELFAAAKNWKQYAAGLIKPFIKGDVLEAGAGIGSNTTLFFTDVVTSWVLLEPDKKFAAVLEMMLQENKLPGNCSVFNGYSHQLKKKFDAILYIDVIEHIENDKAEIATAIELLNSGGHLIVLSPAHNFLRSRFDKAIGHYRRYSKKTLLDIANEKVRIEKILYADSIGLTVSLANKFLLQQQYPTKKQIHFWDSYIIPVSKILDRLLMYSAGKTVIAVWKKI